MTNFVRHHDQRLEIRTDDKALFSFQLGYTKRKGKITERHGDLIDRFSGYFLFDRFMSVLRNEISFPEIECIVLEGRDGHRSVAETTTSNIFGNILKSQKSHFFASMET